MWRNGNVFARMQELLKSPNALCFLCSACTYSYCGAGVQHGRNALNNKEYGWQGRDEDEFLWVTMATEWQRRKMVRLKAFSADAILMHRVGFSGSPLPPNSSSSLKPCTLQPIPKHPFIIPTLTLPYALDLSLTCKIPTHPEHQVCLTRSK